MSEVIGIFGDSYATRSFINNNPVSWVDILAFKFNYNIKCYAQAGTSLFWSYKQFMKYKDKCSKIIFSITSHDRLYLSVNRVLTYPIGNLPSIEMLLNSGYLLKTDPNYPVVLAAQGYYKYLLEPEYCMWVHAKLIAEIIDICQKESKQLIMMPMRDDDIHCQNIFTNSLHAITIEEQRVQFGDSKFRYEVLGGSRACHMSDKNNLIMATVFNDLLQGKQRTISLSDFVFEKIDNPELYWNMK